MSLATGDRNAEQKFSPAHSSQLEQHISQIPQQDGEEANLEGSSGAKPGFLKKLKNKLSDKVTRKDGDALDEAALEEPQSKRKTEIPTKLKRSTSEVPVRDSDSDIEDPVVKLDKADADHERHDSGQGTSDFEVSPLLRIPSNENGGSDVASKRHELERHISRVPQEDEPISKQRPQSSRLEKTLSHIPQYDYDSEDEK